MSTVDEEKTAAFLDRSHERIGVGSSWWNVSGRDPATNAAIL
jgi:hypothetical protein